MEIQIMRGRLMTALTVAVSVTSIVIGSELSRHKTMLFAGTRHSLVHIIILTLVITCLVLALQLAMRL
ncbi:MAG: hypothetical protein OXE84_14300 [Rhodobacteraceae bacterium]|nr:hypothetical protein [Paracoccaceae bacterium]MCY4196111.1 hypothetical protein [Paracoccaceae bacterium]